MEFVFVRIVLIDDGVIGCPERTSANESKPAAEPVEVWEIDPRDGGEKASALRQDAGSHCDVRLFAHESKHAGRHIGAERNNVAAGRPHQNVSPYAARALLLILQQPG